MFYRGCTKSGQPLSGQRFCETFVTNFVANFLSEKNISGQKRKVANFFLQVGKFYSQCCHTHATKWDRQNLLLCTPIPDPCRLTRNVVQKFWLLFDKGDMTQYVLWTITYGTATKVKPRGTQQEALSFNSRP